MKLLKPIWVHHDDKPIFSVDLHQDCQKFATGGQGLDSGRIIIWNLLPVMSQEAEMDEKIPKMLCQMDNHLACVNCVRWSQSGQMLASCSDDKLVMIWRKAKGTSSGVFGTGGVQKNTETWKCISTLRGHSGDVLDLAWAPNDRWLASCSIDNTIIVWDAHSFPTMVAMLKGHTGLVKGVSWDPVGKFLASQSDDRSVKIWKTTDWSCSHTIKEPFEECGGTTHVLRLSWSPDGQYLVSAHAMNSGGPTAQIIEREGWKCDKDFVGHRKAVTCVRFHNSILKGQSQKNHKAQQYCCLAVGSRDRSLSVWMTALQRPLVVIHELFNDSILDLSWGPAKCVLMACSGDGTIACLVFSEKELGIPLPEDDKNALYQRIYGKSFTGDNGSAGGVPDLLIENPEFLNVPQDIPKAPSLPVTLPLDTTNNNHIHNIASINGFAQQSVKKAREGVQQKQVISKQCETRTPDGKRRITPVFIPFSQDINDNATNFESNCYQSAPVTTATQLDTVKPESLSISVNLNSVASSSLPKPIISEAEKIRLDSRLVKTTAPSSSSPSQAIVQPNFPNKSALGTFPKNSQITASTHRSSLAPPQQYQASTSGPKLNITPGTVCEYQKTALEHRVHVRNGCVQTSCGFLAKVTAYTLPSAEKLWQAYIGSPIVNVNFCREYVMLCCLDGSLRLLYMRTGIAVLPVISLASAALQCCFCPLGKLVGVITDCGILRIWNINDGCISLSATCSEILGKSGSVSHNGFTITENGVPLVLFTNGNSYAYSTKMASWLVVSSKDPALRYGLHATVPKEFPQNYLSYPLTTLQAATQGFAPNVNIATSHNVGDTFWQYDAKISFIENQIKLCESTLNSPDELKHWYTMLAYHLALGNNETRLRLFLNELLDFKENILKSKMLQEEDSLICSVFHILKQHLKWQRLFMEYQQLYEESKLMPSRKKRKLEVDQVENNGHKLSDMPSLDIDART